MQDTTAQETESSHTINDVDLHVILVSVTGFALRSTVQKAITRVDRGIGRYL